MGCESMQIYYIVAFVSHPTWTSDCCIRTIVEVRSYQQVVEVPLTDRSIEGAADMLARTQVHLIYIWALTYLLACC